jgi:hypothetical protein
MVLGAAGWVLLALSIAFVCIRKALPLISSRCVAGECWLPAFLISWGNQSPAYLYQSAVCCIYCVSPALKCPCCAVPIVCLLWSLVLCVWSESHAPVRVTECHAARLALSPHTPHVLTHVCHPCHAARVCSGRPGLPQFPCSASSTRYGAIVARCRHGHVSARSVPVGASHLAHICPPRPVQVSSSTHCSTLLSGSRCAPWHQPGAMYAPLCRGSERVCVRI